MTDTTNQRSRFWSAPILNKFAPPETHQTHPENPTEAKEELAPWDVPGSSLRTNARAAHHGFYAPALDGAPTTTKQAEILNTALIGPPTGARGIANGRDVLSRTMITHDAITAYNANPREISSPNEVILGDVGAGKSSFTKTVKILRPLILEKRRAVVFDKKDQAGEGEYANVVRRYGAEPIRFTTDGSGTTLNLLDPMIARGTGVKGQSRLLNIATRLGRGDQPLTEWEEEALRAGLKLTLASFDEGRIPVTADVLPNLGRIVDDPAYADLSPAARDALHHAGLSVRWTLNGLLDEYGGLLDGETSPHVDLGHKLTSFDLSQLPDDGPAVPVVMAIGHQWLLGRLRQDRGWATTVAYEEGWHLVAGPSAHLIKANQKLSRGLGINNVFVMHKGTDIPPGSPGITIIQEAQSIYIFRQGRPDDAIWCQDTFGLEPETADTIQNLRDGHFVFKYGTHPETHVQHIRSPWEVHLTNTDEALQAAASRHAL
jgi:hypothetical protein